MNLKDIKTLSEIHQETGIGIKTLYKRLEKLIEEGELVEDTHYKKLGKRMPVILSKEGVEKIVKGKGDN